MAKRLLPVLLLLAIHGFAFGAEPGGSDVRLSVLFVGNSYTVGYPVKEITRIGGVPGTFRALAEARGHRVETGIVAPGGQSLGGHLEQGDVSRALQERDWDVVVLQEVSVLPTRKSDDRRGNLQTFFESVGRFGELIAELEPDARIVLYETWAREKSVRLFTAEDPVFPGGQAQMFEDLQTNYAKAAEMVDARVAPVGRAWQRVFELRPEFRLHAEDDHHANAEGSYLSALVFYATLLREDPRGLPALAGIDHEDATFLQTVAWEIVEPRLEAADPLPQPTEAGM